MGHRRAGASGVVFFVSKQKIYVEANLIAILSLKLTIFVPEKWMAGKCKISFLGLVRLLLYGMFEFGVSRVLSQMSKLPGSFITLL